MKAYVISTAERLKEIVPLMKWQKDKDRVAAFARKWSGNAEEFRGVTVRIEIGKSAQVFSVTAEGVTLLGTMNLAAAKAFTAKEGEKNEDRSRVVPD